MLLLLISGLFAAWTTTDLVRANPCSRLPWAFRQPPEVPLQVRLLSIITAATTIMGVGLLGTVWGYWAVLAIPAAWAGGYLIRFAHNRDIDSAAPRTGTTLRG